MNDVEFLGAADRSIGTIYLCRYQRPEDRGRWTYEVRIEGQLLMSSLSPLSERRLATSAAAAHQGSGPLRILIGGLGLGYTAQAALESPRASTVRVVEAMDFVTQWLEDGLLPLSEQLNAEPRLEIVQGDVYADLLAPASETWDLILVDVDHAPDMPLDPASLEFYTPHGQARVREHLAPGGILAVWSAHDNEAFAEVLAAAYAKAWREEVDWVVDDHGEEDSELHNVLFFGAVAG